MSGLAGLLAGHHPPGVYQWHAAFGPEDVRHTVEHAGAQFAYVDGWTHQEKDELLEAFAEALGVMNLLRCRGMPGRLRACEPDRAAGRCR